MAPNRPSPDAEENDPILAEETDAERWELLDHIQAALEPLMVVLGLVFLVLLLLDFTPIQLTEPQQLWASRIQWGIYVVFVVDFGLRLVVAPSKLRFLRASWLTALSLLLPVLRPLRALQAARALRSMRLVRLLGGINRGMRVLRRVTRGAQFAYFLALTVLVVLSGALGVLYFDRGVEGASIQNFGNALWWAATMITTISIDAEPVSSEGRVISFLLRLYGLSVFGYITASIATYFIGREAEEREATSQATISREQLGALQREIALLREELARRE